MPKCYSFQSWFFKTWQISLLLSLLAIPACLDQLQAQMHDLGRQQGPQLKLCSGVPVSQGPWSLTCLETFPQRSTCEKEKTLVKPRWHYYRCFHFLPDTVQESSKCSSLWSLLLKASLGACHLGATKKISWLANMTELRRKKRQHQGT